MNATILIKNGKETSFTTTASANVIEDPGSIHKWRIVPCTTTNNAYEHCSSYGDGEVCSPHMAQKGEC